MTVHHTAPEAQLLGDLPRQGQTDILSQLQRPSAMCGHGEIGCDPFGDLLQ